MEVESSSSSNAPLAKHDKPTSISVRGMNANDGDLPSRSRRRRRKICFCILVLLLALLAFAIIILILAFTVFKPKRPVTTVDSVSLKHLDLSLHISTLSVDLNLTLNLNVSVQNPNNVGFIYTNTTALLKYRGEVVGVAPLPAGKISSHQTLRTSITLTIMADRLLSNSQLYSDAFSGTLPLNTYTRISGKVAVFNVFKVPVVSSASCDFDLNISNRSVGHQQCNYQTKL